MDTDNLHFHDGSGLSARNLISSHSMARFLAGLVDEASMEELLYYLPKGGVEGTVSWMFKGTSALGKIWLKSGSMENIQSYSGYIQSKSGKWYGFSVIANGFSAKPKIFRNELQYLILEIFSQLP